MKLLVDQNLSPRIALLLVEHGQDAVHTMDLGLATAPDELVLDRARGDDRVLVSADSDFGTILAATRAVAPLDHLCPQRPRPTALYATLEHDIDERSGSPGALNDPVDVGREVGDHLRAGEMLVADGEDTEAAGGESGLLVWEADDPFVLSERDPASDAHR